MSISIRDHMVAIAGNGRPFFEVLKDLRLGAFELQLDPDLTTPHVRQGDGTAYSVADATGIATLKRALTAEKVRVSAILLGTDFSSDKAADQVNWAIAATRAAGELGAPAVRVDPLARNKEIPADQVRDHFITGIRQVLDKTADTAVDLAIENHGPFGNDPAFLDHIFDVVNNPRLGVTLDTGNFYWWGVSLAELYPLLERYASRAKHTHIKNINYPPDLAAQRRPIGLDYGKYWCSLDEGNIDLARVVRILRDAGYRRDYCIENEPLGKAPVESRVDILKRDVAAIERAIRQA